MTKLDEAARLLKQISYYGTIEDARTAILAILACVEQCQIIRVQDSSSTAPRMTLHFPDKPRAEASGEARHCRDGSTNCHVPRNECYCNCGPCLKVMASLTEPPAPASSPEGPERIVLVPDYSGGRGGLCWREHEGAPNGVRYVRGDLYEAALEDRSNTDRQLLEMRQATGTETLSHAGAVDAARRVMGELKAAREMQADSTRHIIGLDECIADDEWMLSEAWHWIEYAREQLHGCQREAQTRARFNTADSRAIVDLNHDLAAKDKRIAELEAVLRSSVTIGKGDLDQLIADRDALRARLAEVEGAMKSLRFDVEHGITSDNERSWLLRRFDLLAPPAPDAGKETR